MKTQKDKDIDGYIRYIVSDGSIYSQPLSHTIVIRKPFDKYISLIDKRRRRRLIGLVKEKIAFRNKIKRILLFISTIMGVMVMSAGTTILLRFIYEPLGNLGIIVGFLWGAIGVYVTVYIDDKYPNDPFYFRLPDRYIKKIEDDLCNYKNMGK